MRRADLCLPNPVIPRTLFKTARPDRRDMRTFTIVLLALALGAAGVMAQKKTASSTKKKKSTSGSPFDAGCPLPFASIAQSGLAIDSICPINGLADPKSAEGLQNGAKNNFCASGSPVAVTPAILGKL